MAEEFRPIRGYEHAYQVSDRGNVRNIRTGKLLKPHQKKNGYLSVKLYLDKKATSHYIHRLVADAFLSNPDKLETVNHKNLDKTDNRLCNLEYMTLQDNICHYHNGNAIIRQTAPDGTFVADWKNTAEIIETYPWWNRTNIRMNLNGLSKTAYGFVWTYIK